jgi:hypothetical protein
MADRDIKPPSLVTNQPVGGDSSNDNERQRGGGHRRNPHQRWNQGAHHGGGKFKGKTKEIETNTFDNTGPHDAATFNKSLNNIADYLQLNHGNNISEAICNMTPANIILPDNPQPKPDPTIPGELIPVSEIDTYLWKQAHTKASECKEKYGKNMAKLILLFIINAPLISNMISRPLIFFPAFARIKM